MLDVEDSWDGLPECAAMMELVKSQRKTLMKEVERFGSRNKGENPVSRFKNER